MNTKLTLKLNKKAVERAKRYAQRTNQSLSVIVENYFKIISDNDEKTEIDISPNVIELSGIIKLPEEIDLHEEYGKHLYKGTSKNYYFPW